MKKTAPREVLRSRTAKNPKTFDFSSPVVVDAARLSQRANRDARNEFLVEGLRAIHLALEFDALQTLFFASRPTSLARDLVEKAQSRGVRCVALESAVLGRLSAGDEPQDLVGVATRRLWSLDEAAVQNGVWVALESVRKPGNLGSVLRTGEAAGTRGVIAVGRHVDFFAPGAIRASMGAFWTQILVRASWDEVFAFKNRHQTRWIGTSPDAATPYDQTDFGRDLWLWMGDERAGLSNRVLNSCAARVAIPMRGRVDSLNLGVATGILLFEMRRQNAQNLEK